MFYRLVSRLAYSDNGPSTEYETAFAAFEALDVDIRYMEMNGWKMSSNVWMAPVPGMLFRVIMRHPKRPATIIEITEIKR